MKNLLFIFFSSISPLVYSQLADPLQFQNKIHDFGEVPEQNGPVLHEFIFINKATRPVSILAVQPSCGCTTPGWTKEPILTGKTGSIKASFDPKGRPGYFNKSLTVSTDFDGNPIVLQIKGTVVEKNQGSVPSDLVAENGSLRFRSGSFNLGKVFINREPASVEFSVFNHGKDSVRFLGATSPPHIKLLFPDFLPPQSSGKLKITYNAKLQGQYGFCTNNILVKTNDTLQPDKSFAVYATVEEYFAPLTLEEQSLAPKLNVDSYELDFGKIRSGEVVRSVKFRNTGKKLLQIRSVQSNCSCLTTKLSNMTLKPEEEASIEFRFDPTAREGLQNKALTIYSNDPTNPVQRILVKGYIGQ
jgi:hypothetical protein